MYFLVTKNGGLLLVLFPLFSVEVTRVFMFFDEVKLLVLI
jgi:hypothetical protein